MFIDYDDLRNLDSIFDVVTGYTETLVPRALADVEVFNLRANSLRSFGPDMQKIGEHLQGNN